MLSKEFQKAAMKACEQIAIEKNKMETLKVIFRTDKACGEVMAFFPELPGTNKADTCLMYAHIGQHSSASILYALENTRLSTLDEIEPLLAELKSIYETGQDAVKLKVTKKFMRQDFDKRIEALA